MTKTVAVIDYGIGNVYSVCNALNNIGVNANLTSKSSEIAAADYVILPGVGAFARAINALKSSGLDEVIMRHVDSERPFLGICIGMQMLMDKSMEFGANSGLGLIKGNVEKIPELATDGEKLLIPHIAWAKVTPPEGKKTKDWQDGAFVNLAKTPRSLYFVHSYHCVPEDDDNLIAVAEYGGNNITAAIKHNNILGVQFHPERSSEAGALFLQGFLGQ